MWLWQFRKLSAERGSSAISDSCSVFFPPNHFFSGSKVSSNVTFAVFENNSERDCESVLLTPPIFIRFVSVTGRSKLAAGSHCCSEITGQRVNGEKGWSDQRSSIGSGDQQRLRQLFSLPLLGGNASRHSTGPEIPAPAEKTVTVFTP